MLFPLLNLLDLTFNWQQSNFTFHTAKLLPIRIWIVTRSLQPYLIITPYHYVIRFDSRVPYNKHLHAAKELHVHYIHFKERENSIFVMNPGIDDMFIASMRFSFVLNFTQSVDLLARVG